MGKGPEDPGMLFRTRGGDPMTPVLQNWVGNRRKDLFILRCGTGVVIMVVMAVLGPGARLPSRQVHGRGPKTPSCFSALCAVYKGASPCF